MRQNLTLSLEKELIAKLRVIAAQRSTSISGLLSDEFQAIVDREDRYDQAARHALAALDAGWPLEGTPLQRDELDERKAVR